MTLDDFLRLLPSPRKSGTEFTDFCPVHEPPGIKHKTRSLNVRQRGDSIVLICRSLGCSQREICQALGVDPRELWTKLPGRITRSYSYNDEQQQLQYQITRHEPGADGRKKEFRPWVPDPTKASGWKLGLDGARRVLYHLPALLANPDVVFLPEGEKDCEYLESLGLLATTNCGGAEGWKEQFGYAEALRGRTVIICGHNDDAGRKLADTKAHSLNGVAAIFKIIYAPEPFNDMAEWRPSKQDLFAAVDVAPEWKESSDIIASEPGASATGWPDPSLLGDELPPVQHFAREFLPKSFLPLVEDVSERMQTPMDYAAASVIVALAGCVNRRATMQPKAEDASWQVIPNLWGAVIAPPGFMKSPVQRQVTLPLTKIEEGWRDEHHQEEEGYNLAKEQCELKWQAWREEAKKSYKKGASPPAPPAKAQQAPIQKRLILTSSTFEKLHEILGENPAGVLVLRDELTGWLAELDKPGRENERAFYLEAWNGDTGFSVDRIGRGSIYVPATCVSLLGNIQPTRLRSYLSDAVEGGPNDDGLFQRFQILVWPDPPRDWKLIDRPPKSSAEATAAKVFSTLAHLSSDSPVRMHFDCGAQQLFFKWLAALEGKVRGVSELHPAMISHLSKYRSLMPSLAALFELADRAAADDELAGKITVSLEHAMQAAVLCKYLESHARRVYACIVSPECRAARELARHIQAGDLSNPFKTRDVYLKGWSGLDDAERVRSAIELLEDAAWVRREESPRPQNPGRPAETWRINPKVVHHEK